ncbi:hypothetical protein GCM10011502_12590 [Oceanisphaera marina]|uniref:Zinc resistance-associated protein n=1 Tax=Oceanisphaera marina TaxID=2017550 RepID=A0ABQ1IJC0_9GAMM|nr:hypothetical protein [Oceanisphaera marina]GGB40746.1 hypothetical protein GCM10011502_12590 [Oceanisphaera marina]
MMKMKYSALLLATSLLAAPALVNAADHHAEQMTGHHEQNMNMKEGCEGEHKGMHKQRHHGQRHHQMMGAKMMDPARFEQHIAKRMEKLETPELKSQFIASYQARLASAEQGRLLRKLMAEHKAEQITDNALKAATLEKITADHKLKQLRIKLMQDKLTEASKG